MKEQLADSPTEEQKRASNPQASVWVSASAGSGKTRVLVNRVLALLLGGTEPSRILCLTFTKAAAAEMAIRINTTLGLWATSPNDILSEAITNLTGFSPGAHVVARARTLLAYVLESPGGLKIQTIHSFCESLLGRFPVEAGITPQFEVIDESSAAEMLEIARDKVLVLARNQTGSHRKISEALAIITQHIDEGRFTELMVVLANERSRLRELLEEPGGLDLAVKKMYRYLGADSSTDDKSLIATACKDDAFDLVNLNCAARVLADGETKKDLVRGSTIGVWLDSKPEQRIETFDVYASCFLTAKSQPHKRLISRRSSNANPTVEPTLVAEAYRLSHLMERRAAHLIANSSASLLCLGEALIREYDVEKAFSAKLDYDDLIYTARRLLQRPGIAPWVLYKLDGGLDHILIDEAQDTNPDQWAVIAALSEEFFSGVGARSNSRSIFAVGDVKQSIYSFQRADPAAFYRMRKYFSDRISAAEKNWHEVSLDLSFRSTEAVLNVIDAVFGDPVAADGVIEGGREMRHLAARAGHSGLVEVWPLAFPNNVKPEEPWVMPVNNKPRDSPRIRLANVIARRIHGWIGREVMESRNRVVRAGDILVLVRQRGSFVEELVRCLKEVGVPVSGVDRMVLTEQLAPMDLIVLGKFLLLPDDDLTLATVLKGPFLGFNDDDLFRLAWHRGSRSLWSRLGQLASTDGRYATARGWLKNLLALTDFSPPYELFSHILVSPTINELSGRNSLLARLGSDAGDAIDEFLNLALKYERKHIPSLQGFLHWIEKGQAEVKRDLEKSGRDEVRVMTIHGAKGLEAPIVILPDTVSTPIRNSPPILWHKGLPLWPPKREIEEKICRAARVTANELRDQEYRRLLYVAMSRAEDRLYVCGWIGRQRAPENCWYNLIVKGVKQLDDSKEFLFKERGKGGWSGSGFRLQVAQSLAARSDGLDGDSLEEVSRVPTWSITDPDNEPMPLRPVIPSMVESKEISLRSPLEVGDSLRIKRGLLIHQLLEILPNIPEGERREGCRNFLARKSHRLNLMERESIEFEVFSVLTNPVLEFLFIEEGRAEVPIVGRINCASGPIPVSGRIDRLVIRNQEILAVDYKTNQVVLDNPEEVPEDYLRQMAAYREVLTNIWQDRLIRCALLWTNGPHLMYLEEWRLDRFFRDS